MNQTIKKQQQQQQNLLKGLLSSYISDPLMLKILKQKGIVKLLPVQCQTFMPVYKGQDIVAKDRTGSGKTIAYSLPIITRMRQCKLFQGKPHIRYLIIVPTRQLAIQVSDQVYSLKYKDRDDFVVAAVYGGTRVTQHIDVLRKGADIIVGTPGRILDLIQKRVMQLNYLSVICLDEADQMLNIGFKLDIQKIFMYIKAANKQKIQCLMFSATIPDWIWKMSQIYQSKSTKYIDMIKQNNNQTSKTVEHYCIFANNTQQKQYYIGPLIQYFSQKNKKYGKIIIFCQTKRDVDRIGRIKSGQIIIASLHGDYLQQERQRVYHQFKYGKIQCLVATNVAARGLDFPQIDLIIQMQPPKTTDAYIHRSGRTGRVGRSGICVTLYNKEQGYYMEKIQYQAKITFKHIEPEQVLPKRTKQANYDYNNYGNNNINKNKNNDALINSRKIQQENDWNFQRDNIMVNNGW